MAKRKRNQTTTAPAQPNPKHRVHHPVISLYYPHVLSLRQYLLRQLPVSSKLRRRRIASLSPSAGSADQPTHSHSDLPRLLDTTLVGVLHDSSPLVSQERQRDLLAFTQSQSGSQLGSTCAQSDVCQGISVE